MHTEQLHVIGVYANPRRYASRERLFLEWIERALDSGVRVTVVEHAFGERPYVLDANYRKYARLNIVQVRGGPEHELWLKEGLINLGLARLPEDARYIVWEDTDIEHTRADWAVETLHMLQHHRVGQTWTHAMDLDPVGNCARNEWGRDVDRSFAASWVAGDFRAAGEDYGVPSRALLANMGARDPRQHYGYSWAIRRDALTGIGRLIDWMVTGSADYHMALGFAGALGKIGEVSLADGRPGLSTGYVRRLREFAARCEAHIRQDIGCVPGTILHHWHGPKRNRFYLDRKAILLESGFDPDADLAYDINGLPTLVSDNRVLRDGLRRYLTARNEDSIDP